MKKKLMSCLVVLAFMFSIAVPSGFANNNGVATSNGGFTMSIIKEDGLKEENANDPEVTKVTSRITAVYNYAGGVLISVGDANKGITLISNGKAFASLSFNFEDGTYSFANINIDGLDWDKIEKCEGSSDKEKLKNFLISLGIPRRDLLTQQPEYHNGGPVNITSSTSDKEVQTVTGGKYKNVAEYEGRPFTDVAWLEEAAATLKAGISSGISIGFGANGGATLTTMKNGQPQATYSAQNGPDGLFMTTKYNYTNGFLSTIENYSFEVDRFKTNVTDGQSDEDAKKNANLAKSYEDKMNKWLAENPDKKPSDFEGGTEAEKKAYNDEQKISIEKVVYKKSTTVTHFNAYGQQAYVEKDGKTIQEFNYAHNGSLVSSKDLTTNMTTYYVGGKVSQTVNDKGYIVNQYNYNNNGTINEVVSYNNNTATQRTAFLYGKALATSDLSAGDISADKMREGYAKITNLNTSNMDKYRELASAYHFTNVQAYRGHLNNAGFMNFILNADNFASLNELDGDEKEKALKENEKEIEMAKRVMSYSSGISPIASVNLKFGKGQTPATKITIDGKTFETEYETNEKGEKVVKKGKLNGKEVSLTAENKAKNYMYSKMTASQRKAQLKDDEGNALCDDNGNFKEGKSIENISMEKSTDKNKSAHKVTTDAKTYESLTVETTVNSHGAAVFTMTCTMKFNEQPIVLGGYSDPAVIGVVKSFVDADGNVIKDVDAYLKANPDAKVYAKVSAEGVNMMDGSGFKAADGEEIFVEVSAEQANEINVGEKAMFMGDVSTSANGKYTMRTNDNYTVTVNGKEYKGMVSGKDLDAAKAEIQNESAKAMNGESKYDWMNTNTKDNRNLFNLGSGNYLNDWKQGWDILRANLG